MVNFKVVAGSMLVAFSFAATQVRAETDWLKKGTDLLKTVDPESVAQVADTGEIAEAFKQALTIGSEKVVSQLGRVGGFSDDAAVRISLPKELESVKGVLATVGMSDLVDDLALKLNRAAEVAVPKAEPLFKQSIADMTFDDVKTIYNGPDDSATRYFQAKMSPELHAQMAPIVAQSLSEVGAVQAYDRVMSEYQALPFLPDVKAELTDYVVDQGADGIFYYLGQQEAAIRKNPAEQSTALLKKVFGAK